MGSNLGQIGRCQRSRDVKDGKADQISREPEMVKAFRDTWSDGIHSYMTYFRPSRPSHAISS